MTLRDWANSLPWVVGGILFIIALLVLHKPLKALGRLFIRTGAGLAVLYVLSRLGALIGVTLGVNFTNALLLGLLGIPGLGLLFLLHWVLI